MTPFTLSPYQEESLAAVGAAHVEGLRRNLSITNHSPNVNQPNRAALGGTTLPILSKDTGENSQGQRRHGMLETLNIDQILSAYRLCAVADGHGIVGIVHGQIDLEPESSRQSGRLQFRVELWVRSAPEAKVNVLVWGGLADAALKERLLKKGLDLWAEGPMQFDSSRWELTLQARRLWVEVENRQVRPMNKLWRHLVHPNWIPHEAECLRI